MIKATNPAAPEVSGTPRTDALLASMRVEVASLEPQQWTESLNAAHAKQVLELARQLERELAQARAAVIEECAVAVETCKVLHVVCGKGYEGLSNDAPELAAAIRALKEQK